MALQPNEMLTPHFITGAIEERPSKQAIKQQYIGSTIFGMREVPERRLMWDAMIAENNLAGFYGTKGEPIPGDDLLFKSHWADLIDIMAARHLDHDVINNVRDPGMAAVYRAGGSAIAIKALRQRFNDHLSKRIAWCDDAVDAQLEYLAINALRGSIVWPPTTAAGGAITPAMPHWNATMTVSFTYPLLAAFQQSASTLAGHNARTGGAKAWNSGHANTDPVLDLEVISEYMVELKGLNADDMLVIMSRSTLSQIAFLTKVLDWIRGKQYEAPEGRFVEISKLKEFIKTRLGYDIRTYDSQWTYVANFGTAPETVSRVKFLPEGRVIIIPKSELSDLGYMATTFHKDSTGNFKSGKYAWMKEDDEPPFLTRMGIGVVAWPILEQPESIFNLNAFA